MKVSVNGDLYDISGKKSSDGHVYQEYTFMKDYIPRSLDTTNCNDIVNVNGTYYILHSAEPGIIRTEDWIHYENLSFSRETKKICSLAFHDNTIVIPFSATPSVGTCQYGVVSHDNGETWSEIDLKTNKTWRDIAYGNGVYVAIADGAISRSIDDGNTWTTVSNMSGRYLHIAYGNGRFFGYAQSSGSLVLSEDDGNTWRIVTLPGVDASSDYIYGVFFHFGKYLVCVDRKLFISEDFESWNSITLNQFYADQAVEYDNTLYFNRISGSSLLFKTKDLVTFETFSIPYVVAQNYLAFGPGREMHVIPSKSSCTEQLFSFDGRLIVDGYSPKEGI